LYQITCPIAEAVAGAHRTNTSPALLSTCHATASAWYPLQTMASPPIDRPIPGTPRPAVFLDRDGTILEHVHYLSDPAQVALLPGAALAIRQLRSAGFAIVVVTNQSGIGRGLYSVDRLHEIHEEMNRQLASHGSKLDAIYFCPDAPPAESEPPRRSPNRKPEPGMLLQAAADLLLDLPRSWMIGDLITDALAGLNAGCRAILLQSGPQKHSPETLQSLAGDCLILPDLEAAAAYILRDLATRH
jgi:D-glycero-D-manno-heptose 1,7-bisphosphate phosphatase